jgi:hypothetical protein
MSYNFALPRLVLFSACVIAFFLLGGFALPEVSDNSFMDPARVNKAWIWCVIMFLVGAGCVSVVDHFVGLMEPSNLRLLYVIIGILLMAGSFVWQQSLKQGAAGTSSPSKVASP